MEKTTETTNNETTDLKTLEDIDKGNSSKEENNATSNDELIKQIEALKSERDSFKDKYVKAVEVNNQLYQRLTSPKPVETNALDEILKRF